MTVDLAAMVGRLENNLGAAIKGKDEAIRLVLIGLLAGGHVLLEDVPGTGKTMLARALAKSVGGEFRRIQFTPDLLPADITGSSFYSPKDGVFIFREGPVFANVVLADEINRASPRTQSALLEVMSEGQITIDGRTRALPSPFFVIATQNPSDSHGTYPLPEAQLDRFALRVTLGYPELADELNILASQKLRHPVDTMAPVAMLSDILEAQEKIRSVRVDAAVSEYLLRLVQTIRADTRLRLAISTRGSLALYRTAQVRAALLERDFVLPEDIKALAAPVFAHRLALDTKTRYAGLLPGMIVEQALSEVPVPR